jgi:hypothetical protein
MLSPQQKAEVSTIINRELRGVLRDVVAHATPLPEEQIEIASGVVGLLLRDMYRQRGQAWLEELLKVVLQPLDAPLPPT